MTTPLQLVQATALVATGGQASAPKLTRDGQSRRFNINQYSDKDWKLVQAGMLDVINGEHGTARVIASDVIPIAGKSGTAQVISRQQGEEIDTETLSRTQQNHALFIAYGPAGHEMVATNANTDHSIEAASAVQTSDASSVPLIAVSVVVEHGVSGSRIAAPVAKTVIEAWAELNKTEALVVQQTSEIP